MLVHNYVYKNIMYIFQNNMKLNVTLLSRYKKFAIKIKKF